MSLTSTQTDMLELLAANDREMDGPELARLLYGNHTTPQGAHQTAASLVRHGFIDKTRAVPVAYRINVEGLLLVSEIRKVKAALR